MKVRAIRDGFYNDSIVKSGTEFELKDIVVNRQIPNVLRAFEKKVVKAEEQFSDDWMESVVENESSGVTLNIPVDGQEEFNNVKIFGSVIDHSGEVEDNNKSDDSNV